MAAERGDWAGIPMPLEGRPLIVEPRYPKAAELMEIGKPAVPEEDRDCKIRNSFVVRSKMFRVVIWNDPDGSLKWGKLPAANRLGLMLNTLEASDAWGVEQEGRAVQTLERMVRHRAFKHYLLTGMFLETSKRTGITYVFRRLRPTIALRPDKSGKDMRILAALCLHPIAYYDESWAGAMTPTDDVCAHLALMRGDEPMFWRKANQHPPWALEAGL